MADRTELAFLKNALSARLLDPQEQTALENLVFQRLLAGNLQIDINGQITGGGLSTGSSGPASLVQLLDGTVGAPSLSFVNELSTGRYRSGPGDVGESVLGVRVLDWSATRLQLTNINLSFANDNVNDIGAVGVNRPRDLFLGRNASVSGALNVAGAATLGSTLSVTGTTTLGPLLFAPDLTNDIGASGASRPRNLYLGNNAVIGGTLSVVGTTVIGGTLTLTVPLPGSSGGTGTAYFTVVGPTAPRTYTFPDANATVLTSAAPVTVPQGGTGLSALTAHGVLLGEGTSAIGVATTGAQGTSLIGRGAGTDPGFALPASFAGNPAGSATGANKMFGFGAAGVVLTPATTGRITVVATGNAAATGAGAISLGLYYGIGAAPVAGAALVGTAIGGGAFIAFGNGVQTSVSFNGLVSGLAIGTQYWFDLATTGTYSGPTSFGVGLSFVVHEC